jgi:deoxyribonuclease-2
MSNLLSAFDETGKPVDWWFSYKVACKSDPARTSPGNNYLYYDANIAKTNKPLSLSANKIDQSTSALSRTIAQLYAATPAKNPGLGWFAYNDQNPDDKSGYKNPVNGKAFEPTKGVDSRGHTKGVLAFDLETNSGFWLVHSVPMFVLPSQDQYPTTGLEMAQSFLCISLANADTALALAKVMYQCYQPNVYAASALPKALVGKTSDFRVLMMNDKVSTPTGGDAALCAIMPFASRAGINFKAIAKNDHWGQTDNPKLNFYNDLVGPTLGQDIDVETWQRGPIPTATDKFSTHKVVDIKDVNLKPLGASFAWPETVDHAKLAISDKDEKVHWVCVGGMNFNISQEKRGGGTVAFQCEPLWKGLNSILSANAQAGTAPPAKQTAPTAKPASKPISKPGTKT